MVSLMCTRLKKDHDSRTETAQGCMGEETKHASCTNHTFQQVSDMQLALTRGSTTTALNQVTKA
eukprot:m.368130 g.368130  ORF g.368130 m.368130 type:complete len:64 (+) comp43991_c0_seq1:73-264(+)